MPNLTQIELPSGTTYDLVDSEARDLIAAINNWSYVVATSAATTPKDVTWDNDGTTVTGTLVAAASTMYKIYLVPSDNGTNDVYDEYITVNPSGTTYKWEMFGNTKLPDMGDYLKNKSGKEGSTAGDLAYKNSASGSGTVAVPKTFTTTITPAAKDVSVTGTTTGSVSVTKSKVTVSKASSGTATYTPAGTNASSSVSGSCSVTPEGTVNLTTATVDIKPNTSGTAANKYTPAGSNASSSVSGSCSVTPSGTISVGTGTANYTPAGSVAAPKISVATAGSTATVKNPTSKTVVTDMSVADPSSTTATGELVYCSVSGTKLSLKKFVETTGASISTSNLTVKTGDATYSASAPAFTGTGAELKFTGSTSSGTISGTAAAQTFTGTATYLKTATAVGTAATFEGSASSGTISGTAAAQAFTGTGARLVTDSDVATGASFTGASMTSTGSYTPAAGSATTTIATTENKTVSVTVS